MCGCHMMSVWRSHECGGWRSHDECGGWRSHDECVWRVEVT